MPKINTLVQYYGITFCAFSFALIGCGLHQELNSAVLLGVATFILGYGIFIVSNKITLSNEKLNKA